MLVAVIIVFKDVQGYWKLEGISPSAAATDPNSCLKVWLNTGNTAITILKHCSGGKLWSPQSWRSLRAIWK